jgi:hypothetical protein
VHFHRSTRSFLKDNLRTDGRDSFIFQGSASFTLSEDYPSAASIVIYKNGTVLSTGWSYNSSTNIVTITALLATNDIILICYSYYDKYSDTELLGYLECALARFSQFGYKKLFKLNDARTDVTAIDNVNPTANEAYQIAIITSIETDAHNIEIRTKDFTVTAEEKESKSDLIGKAIMQFTTWYGDFSFDEDYREDVV